MQTVDPDETAPAVSSGSTLIAKGDTMCDCGVNGCNVLHCRLMVERLLNMCLVPYTLSVSERMQRLYQLYSSLDEPAVK